MKEIKNINTNEAKEILVEQVKRIQSIDTQVYELKEDRKDILNQLKDEGFNHSMINKAISDIRKSLETDEAKKDEQGFYTELIEETHIVKSVKI